ncbi:GAF domain-containing protein [Synechocystis sp. FACHB-383]|uniref:GAF domain-containing protein n=1 Tax=Synechocystis sp. FACHB-383 TaxID=2692864 RepID=UPI0016872C69|nr:GAF domain-containing protein [Synechocystis sp. FACHB-383]MBD2655356.1 GAF domain-containing protein [Synechocystis sp. FACHB-383]
MQEAAIPSNEQQRLAHLQNLNILDTPSDEKFERITRLLCRVLDMPVAAISLVDENRQWFKSIRGSDLTETPRGISFCAHTILEDRTLIIPDALSDPRFADNPLVIDSPHIRFYAGHPLKMLDNIHVGTLCVYDTKPREMSDDDIQFLEDLSVTVANELKAYMLKSFFTV